MLCSFFFILNSRLDFIISELPHQIAASRSAPFSQVRSARANRLARGRTSPWSCSGLARGRTSPRSCSRLTRWPRGGRQHTVSGLRSCPVHWLWEKNSVGILALFRSWWGPNHFISIQAKLGIDVPFYEPRLACESDWKKLLFKHKPVRQLVAWSEDKTSSDIYLVRTFPIIDKLVRFCKTNVNICICKTSYHLQDKC